MEKTFFPSIKNRPACIQRLFGNKWLTNYFIAFAKRFPNLVDL